MTPPPDPPADSSCVVIGNGPPLVVFPGLARGPVKNSRSYLGLAHVTKRRVYVINRPPGLPHGLTMPQLAAHHAQILSQLFSEPVDLLGASTGGAIALQLAVNHPSLVNRLIVVAAASWLGEEGRQKLRRYGNEVACGCSGAKVLASVLASPSKAWLMAFLIWASYKLSRAPIPNDMLATIDAEVSFDVTSQLNQIRAPTLLIAGAQDRAFPLNLVQTTAAGIPNSRLIVYPKAGHLGTMLNRHFGRDVATFLSTTILSST
ncbi:MAG TPA: alpha/beta fold hydrolase [Pirellulales bacterium]|jgi:pimeloyl-ACP methyl ester carboxylesterase